MSRSKSKTKKYSQREHAKVRFMERLGVFPEKSDFEDMIGQIHDGRAEFISRDSNRVTKWWVSFREKRIAVVYDKQRKEIVTVLKDEWVEKKIAPVGNPEGPAMYFKDIVKQNREDGFKSTLVMNTGERFKVKVKVKNEGQNSI